MGSTPESLNSPVAKLTGEYQSSSPTLRQQPSGGEKSNKSKEILLVKAQLIQQTLALFDIEVSLGNITLNPTITRYELIPAPGVKLEKITVRANNIAAALKAEHIHILAPIPGTSYVGIEVPNLVRTKTCHAGNT